MERICRGLRSETAKSCIGGCFGHRQVRRESVAADYAQHYVQTAEIAPHGTAQNLTAVLPKLLETVDA
jgi:hypothetical protein